MSGPNIKKFPITVGGSVAVGMNNWWTPIGGVDASGNPQLARVDSSGNVSVSVSASGTTSATLTQAVKTVAATGTPELMAAATLLVDSVVIYGQKALATNNTSTCYIGPSAGNGTQLLPITAGSYVSLSAPPGKKIDLHTIYIDVGTNGDGVVYTALG